LLAFQGLAVSFHEAEEGAPPIGPDTRMIIPDAAKIGLCIVPIKVAIHPTVVEGSSLMCEGLQVELERLELVRGIP
jgi:hypothetical protein